MNHQHANADPTAHERRAERLALCRAAVRKPEARRLVHGDRQPREIVDELASRGLLSDAIRFLAMVLPKRPSIWWGTLCAWDSSQGKPSDDEAAALEATLHWLREPSETHRRAAERLGRLAGRHTPAGALATAAFNSGGNISRPELPAVEPGDSATGRLVAGAILLSAARYEPRRLREHYRQYLAIGLEVADGRLGWLSSPWIPFMPPRVRLDASQPAPRSPHVPLRPNPAHAAFDSFYELTMDQVRT